MLRNPLFLLLSLLLTVAVAHAQPDCFDYATAGWPEAGSLTLAGGINDLADTGDGHLLVAGDQGVAVCDLADPANPALVWFMSTDQPVREVATDGSLVAALTEDDRLLVGVLTSPGRGAWSGELPLSYATRPAVSGGTIVFRQGNAELATVDATDPKNPRYLGWVSTPEAFNDLAAGEGLVFLASEANLLLVYNLVDPASPQLISAAGRLASGLSVAVEFPRVHVANVSKVISYDLSTPTEVVELGETSRLAGFVNQVAAGRGLCAAVSTEGHIYRLDAPVDAGPSALVMANVAPGPTAVACVNGIVVVGQADGTFHTLDPDAGRYPDVVRESPEDLPRIITASEDLVYAMDEDHPLGPRLTVSGFGPSPEAADIGFLPFFGNAQALEVRRDRLVMATSLFTIALVDVSDPSAPRYLSQRGQDVDSEDVCIPGRAVCALGRDAFGDETLVIYDVTSSDILQLAGAVRMPYGSIQTVGWREHALIRTRYEMNGMLSVDCRDPRSAVVTDWVGVPGVSVDLMAERHHAYLLTSDGLVHVISLADPANLEVVNVVDVGGDTLQGSLAVVGNHLFVANFDHGMTVVDITDPAQAVVSGAAWTPLTGKIVAGPSGILLNDALYRERSHLPPPCGVLSSAEVPGIVMDLGIRPNPFNPRTELSFTLPEAVPVHLEIYDLGGRLVRRLVGGTTLAEGTHRIPWDGRDQAGTAVASAVYLARLRAGAALAHGKLVLVR